MTRFKPPLRFTTPPTELPIEIDHHPYVVHCGVIGYSNRSLLVGIWRRKGTKHPFEPVSAGFIGSVIHPRMAMSGSKQCELPSTDDEVREALESLLTPAQNQAVS